MEHRIVRSKTRLIVLAAVVAQLGACSSVPNAINPVSWYRGITGASKNDNLGKGQNEENLQEGSNEPFPNLGTVPDAPETALSTIDRNKLVNSLIADRNNAKYANDDLRAGRATPGAPPPPPPPEPATKSAAAPAGPAKAAPAPEQAQTSGDKLAKARPPTRGSEAPPTESSLQSPQIDNPPKGDAVTPAPPPPRIPPAGSAATKAKAPPVPSSPPMPPTDTVMAAPPPPHIPPPDHAAAAATGKKTASAAPTAAGSGARRAAMHHIADVSFAPGSALLSDKVDETIDTIVKQHAKDGGKIRIVGHGEADGANAAVAGFNLALNRAQAVAVALSDKGVPSKDIAVEAAPVAAGGGQDVPRAEIFFEN